MAMNSRKGDPDQGLHIPPERPGIELHLLVENAVNAPPKRLPPRTPSTIGGFESSRQESTHLGAQSSSPSAAPQTVPQEKLGFLVAIVYISIALGALGASNRVREIVFGGNLLTMFFSSRSLSC
jgi:hypothetical protein